MLILNKNIVEVLNLAHSLGSIEQFDKLIDNINKTETADSSSLINKFIILGNIHFLKGEYLKNNKGE